jgi:hypothetical protein
VDIDQATATLRRVGLFSFVCWAAFIAAAMRFEGVMRSPENHLRFAVALIGAAIALFAVARAGSWPRLLYLLSIGYFAYFAAATAWYDLWQIAAVPAEGLAQTLALSIELAMRVVAKEFTLQRWGLGLAQTHDLVLMPVAQLVIVIFLARAMLKTR